jgi:8-oxo-dGTP pyrophosphatase MutT (NUDIX family)
MKNQVVLYSRADGKVHSAFMSARGSKLPSRRSRSLQLPAKSIHPARRGSNRIEQVAAVCFRVSSAGLEFLLVRTRGGRWIFPKGGVEPGLTRAQAAALEAFEEAGAHGRIEEAPFARYRQRKRDKMQESGSIHIVVRAFLCEVLRLGPPQEPNRNRTWFSPEKAKSYLCEDRRADNGAELARIVDRAVTRIQRLGSWNPSQETDALQRVQFEAAETSTPRTQSASFVNHFRRELATIQSSPAIESAVSSYLGEILRLKRNSTRLPMENNRRRLNAKRFTDLALPGFVEENDSAARSPQGGQRVIEITKGQKTAVAGKVPLASKKKN